VYEKTVRRRRAVLGVLVALSLILLTVYFGEAPGGRLHSVQRGFLTALSPIQDGASKALKPVRDLFSGIGETLHARGQLAGLRKQDEILRQQVTNLQAQARRGAEALKLLHLDATYSLDRYNPVSADIVGQSPTLWYSTVLIDKGSGAGVQVDDPVVDADGLVGKVTQVTPTISQVTLITDQSSAVAARDPQAGVYGIIQAKVGDPQSLQLQDLAANANVNQGDYVVTAGTVSAADPSLFPPGIPIGQVTSSPNGTLTTQADVRPLANLRELDTVQVLTRGTTGVPSNQAIDSLPPAGSEPASGGVQASNSQTASTQTGG
jgi:rod shape-determining protein MreC